jgi:hypothetical protein
MIHGTILKLIKKDFSLVAIVATHLNIFPFNALMKREKIGQSIIKDLALVQMLVINRKISI